MGDDILIDGVTTTELRQIAGVRGVVLHMLRSDAPDFTSFGECYFSEVQPAAVKAWKRHTLQTQDLAVPIGRIRLVVFDDRPDSSTRGKVVVFDLGRPDAYRRVRIPPLVWYGFMALGDSPALVVNCADRPHDPAEGETRSANDSRIPYAWPA